MHIRSKDMQLIPRSKTVHKQEPISKPITTTSGTVANKSKLHGQYAIKPDLAKITRDNKRTHKKLSDIIETTIKLYLPL